MIDPTKRPRVSDDTLATICGILNKTAGFRMKSGERSFTDVLRDCALDLRDLRLLYDQFRAGIERVPPPTPKPTADDADYSPR